MTDLEAAATELYALAPEDFVGARTALVKQARAAKDRELATAIGALRKPTRTAWVVNLVARDDPGAVASLLELGDALRAAQDERDGAALRDLSARRRKAIDALVRRGTALAREAGHPPTEATLNEVAQTLQAALGDPAVGEQVRGARLAGAAVYGGFGGPAESAGSTDAGGGGDLAALLAASMPAGKKDAAQKGAAPERDELAERKRRAAAERRAALQQARDDAQEALAEAQRAADATTEEADGLAEEVDRLKDELARAESAEREARTAARTAREDVRARRAALDAAEEELAAAP